MMNLEIREIVQNSYSKKPSSYFMDKVKWKYLVRSVLRGTNVLMIGPSGFGKTSAFYALKEAFPDRPSFVFNLGSMLDAKTSLIGNTHFNKDTGTFFTESEFIKAITTPNAMILLDELTRAERDVHNTLMTVLDGQRYITIDEAEIKRHIYVADGVSFISTANIGVEYSATRSLDRAIFDRFAVKIEVDILSEEEEKKLIKNRYPSLSDTYIDAITKISSSLRTVGIINETNIIISPRTTLEMAGLLVDGFKFSETCEVTLYTLYDGQGGDDSPRSLVRKTVAGVVTIDMIDAMSDETSNDDSNIDTREQDLINRNKMSSDNYFGNDVRAEAYNRKRTEKA